MKSNPIRTCVACKETAEKATLFKLVEREGKYVLDEKHKMDGRSIYICKSPLCVKKISKNKKYNIDTELLLLLMNKIKIARKEPIKALKSIINSGKVTFGIKLVQEQVARNKASLLVLAEDISKKNEEKIKFGIKDKKIPIVKFSTKEELGELFGKDEVTVIAILNKKIAGGFFKALGR
ncbi:DUF448 domain-containing protein [Haliovirga abyssi]|uniref:ABC transporter n=1 Tax=Haliovirga abyssi TaxID=2996794 RepID=A0AAU9DF16_9FUSO|nr:DUF448 domain-containing protein [Haliovirga abyssi]BDU49957.1 ABC transporter [Haliovirga abyssi]